MEVHSSNKTLSYIYLNFNFLMQILTRRGKLLGHSELKVPDLVPHSGIELVWIPFSLQMKFDTNRGILNTIKITYY